MAISANPTTDVTAAAAALRLRFVGLVGLVQGELGVMRSLVTGRKAAVVAALGSADATEMATLYGKLKDFVDTATGGSEPGIPAS
jgi:hypothetical protein